MASAAVRQLAHVKEPRNPAPSHRLYAATPNHPIFELYLHTVSLTHVNK